MPLKLNYFPDALLLGHIERCNWSLIMLGGQLNCFDFIYFVHGSITYLLKQ